MVTRAKDRPSVDDSESPDYWAGYWHSATEAREEEIERLKQEINMLWEKVESLRKEAAAMRPDSRDRWEEARRFMQDARNELSHVTEKVDCARGQLAGLVFPSGLEVQVRLVHSLLVAVAGRMQEALEQAKAADDKKEEDNEDG